MIILLVIAKTMKDLFIGQLRALHGREKERISAESLWRLNFDDGVLHMLYTLEVRESSSREKVENSPREKVESSSRERS